MPRPKTLNSKPSVILAFLGGAVASVLLSALIYLGPVLGFPFVDIPLLLGGVFTSNATVALWLGFWLFFLTGVFIFSAVLALVWSSLPGPDVGYGGAIVKGLLWGLILFIVSGLLFPVLGWLNQLPPAVVARPGVFALGLGLMAALGVLLGHLAYGLSLALIMAMAHGIKPLDTLGWDNLHHADVREGALTFVGRHAQARKMSQ